MTNPTNCIHFQRISECDGSMYTYCAIVDRIYPADKGRGCVCDKYEARPKVEQDDCHPWQFGTFVNASCNGGGYMTK